MPKKMSAPHVLTLAMPKGGVGKTTSTVNIARGLALLGHRPLILDLDERADSTRLLGITVTPEMPTMFEVLAPRNERVELAEAILTTEFGVAIVASTAAVRQYDRQGLGPNGDLKIRRLVSEISADDYDIVLIDTPPQRGPLLTAGLFAANSVIGLVLAGAAEISALNQLDQDMNDLRDSVDEAAGLDYVILARHQDNYRVSKDMRVSLQRDWGEEFLGTVSASVRVAEAGLAGMPVVDFAPDSYPAQDYLRISKIIHERLVNGDE